MICKFKGYVVPRDVHVCMDRKGPFFHCQVNDELCRKCKRKSRGLGDTVAKVTKFFGISPCRDCGERQEFLNELFPYNVKGK